MSKDKHERALDLIERALARHEGRGAPLAIIRAATQVAVKAGLINDAEASGLCTACTPQPQAEQTLASRMGFNFEPNAYGAATPAQRIGEPPVESQQATAQRLAGLARHAAMDRYDVGIGRTEPGGREAAGQAAYARTLAERGFGYLNTEGMDMGSAVPVAKETEG